MEVRNGNRAAASKEGRIARGWRLTMVAWTLIRQDQTMLTLAFAGIASASFFVVLIVWLGGYPAAGSSGGFLGLVALVAPYPSTVISVFFGIALACAANAAFHGEQMGAAEAMRMAYGKRRQILLWSLLSTLVGTLLSEIARRVPGGTRLLTTFLGAAWGLATIFVIPILAMEGRGPVDSLKRSGALVKRRWGEGISGGLAIGAWTVVASLPLVILVAVGAALFERQPAFGLLMIGAGVVGLVALGAAMTATRQVFAVALYRYAIDAPIAGFAPSDLEYPFVPAKQRKRRSSAMSIGAVVLAVLLVALVIGAIVGAPDRQTAEASYFRLDFAANSSTSLEPGAPVTFRGSTIGSVVAAEPGETQLRVVIKVDPRDRTIARTDQAYLTTEGGLDYLRYGP